MANERQCLVCGTTYTHCSRCPGGSNLPSWKNIYDTEECKNIFDICSAYVNGYLKKGDAILKLKSFNMPKHLNDKYQNIVNDILFVDKKINKKRKRNIDEK